MANAGIYEISKFFVATLGCGLCASVNMSVVLVSKYVYLFFLCVCMYGTHGMHDGFVTTNTCNSGTVSATVSPPSDGEAEMPFKAKNRLQLLLISTIYSLSCKSNC